MSRRPARVVVLGGGFAGLYVTSYLARADLPEGALELTLISDRNYFTFLPLLAEMVGGSLGYEDVAFPLRAHARRLGFRFVRARVEGLRQDRGCVTTSVGSFPYDFLVVAMGARPSFFGNPSLERNAMPLVSIRDALAVRHTLLRTAEAAAMETSPARRRQRLSFSVAGAGPSGVEVASEMQRLLRRVLMRDYGLEVPTPVTLVHGGERILNGWDEGLARAGLQILREQGMDVRLGSRVEDFDGEQVRIRPRDGEQETLPTQGLVWTAGTEPATGPLHDAGLPCTEAGHLRVDETLRVAGHDRIFAAGDNVRFEDPRTGQPYPPVAPIAISQGIRVAANIENAVADRPLEPYHAHHAGKIVTLGGGRALTDILGWRAGGRTAWLIYRTVMLLQLVGTRNKMRAMTSLLLDRLFEPSDVYD